MTVAICGAGHSGSTLLGLVLGAHRRCFYAGEAKKTLFIGDEDRPLRKRVCKICGESCPIWSRFVGPPEPDLYEHIAQISGAPVIVDSTKKPEWIEARTAELDALGVPHKRLFLTRDGRAVVNSRVRKYPEEPPAKIVRAWLDQVAKTEALLARRPEDALAVRYEELATDPENVVLGICSFLGIEYEASMLKYASIAQHPLGGNTGTQSVLARARGVTDAAFADIPGRSKDYYEPIRGGFALDLRWKDELPAAVLAEFDASAGEANEAFRWDEEPRDEEPA